MNSNERVKFEDLLKIAGRSDAPVLIGGPTGSGKTRLAKQIHDRSSRGTRGRPFVVINLASLHEGTLESELFGHEKGAFTGAELRRVGRLEMANGGTVFLDEIGDLSLRLQARLLEFLQSRTISPLGSNREVKLDVRIIAATHRDLPRAVKRGEFREDLFHRLRVIGLELKSLNERGDEFDEIVHGCLAEICAAQGRSILKISEDVAENLERYAWPGNFRELRNVLEYAVISATEQMIQFADLPEWFRASLAGESGAPNAVSSTPALLAVREFALSTDYHAALSEFEREYLRIALEKYRGRINQTARKIGMNKTTLIRRVRAYNLMPESA